MSTLRPIARESLSSAGAGAHSLRWNPWTRVGFRVAFVYLGLYGLIGFLSLIPLGTLLGEGGAEAAWQRLVTRIGAWVFGVTITVLPNGSGDTTFNYVELFCIASIALLIAAVWSALDWRRAAYPWLSDGLRIWVRFMLAASMLAYGINKLFKLQFPDLEVSRLTQSYGESSPMGLLWTFMGASDPYTRFAGAMETIGGLLLCFRRTTLLGAVVTAGVLANVVLLNFCYDVPVKLYSSHLLLMAGFLVLPDARRMIDLFILNRPVPAARLWPAGMAPWTRWSLFGIKTVVVAGLLLLNVAGSMQAQAAYGASAPRGLMDGTWEVQQMSVDGVALPALQEDAGRWQRITLWDRPQLRIIAISAMTGAVQRWEVEFVPAASSDGAGELVLRTPEGVGGSAQAPLAPGGAQPERPAPVGSLRYALGEDRALSLEGTIEGRRIAVTAAARTPKQFLLINRGFHWINERPYNR